MFQETTLRSARTPHDCVHEKETVRKPDGTACSTDVERTLTLPLALCAAAPTSRCGRPGEAAPALGTRKSPAGAHTATLPAKTLRSQGGGVEQGRQRGSDGRVVSPPYFHT